MASCGSGLKMVVAKILACGSVSLGVLRRCEHFHNLADAGATPFDTEHPAGCFNHSGHAGSGKTTTALLRLRQLAATWLARRAAEADDPIRILVITYNRTLRGYISELASQQIAAQPNLELTVSTFSHSAQSMLPRTRLVSEADRRDKLRSLSAPFSVSADFLAAELDYLLGRFPPGDLGEYVTSERTGRGSVPPVDRQLRRRILDEIVAPYTEWKTSLGRNWNNLATSIIASTSTASATI